MPKITVSAKKIPDYRAEFLDTHCVFIPEILEKDFQKQFAARISRIRFQEKEEGEAVALGATLFAPSEDSSLIVLNAIFNDPHLFRLLEEVTACPRIGDFVGRIHRSERPSHQILWHGDNTDRRLLALTLGLGDEPYAGAEFQLRKKGLAGPLLREFGQLKFGDAIIFRVAPYLEHRLTPIASGCRTVGVGWFRGEPIP